MTIIKIEETKTYVTFKTQVHKVKINTDELDKWIERFEKSKGQDMYRALVIYLQKKIKPITEAVINGEVYQESFNEIINYILTKEIGVDTITIESNLQDYQGEEGESDEEYRQKLEENK